MLAKPADKLPQEFRNIEKKHSHVGQGLVQYCGTAHNIQWDIVYAC